MAIFSTDVDADGVATITWDLPGRSMNVLTEEGIAELDAAVDRALADTATYPNLTHNASQAVVLGSLGAYLPGPIVDDFEDGNKTEYVEQSNGKDRSSNTTVTPAAAHDGGYGLADATHSGAGGWLYREDQLVERGEGRRPPLGRDPQPLQGPVQEPPIAVPDDEVRGPETARAEDIHTGGDDLGVGLDPGHAEDVQVELPELTEAAPLRALVPEQAGDREPLDRLGQPLAAGGHHPRQRRRHLGTK